MTVSDPLTDLTRREAQVLALIALGRSNQEIAAELYVSVNSVKTYIRTGYRKIGVSRRVEAVRWAMQHGLEATVLQDLSAPPAGLEPAT
ncbi:response regulator transcription factor [Nocardioides sp. MAHUQ-72]|uniref:response regulator transcription factor n=1 Tax=unclassified Nocardioides TaxID=2615069 RepID=UPI00360D5ABA